MKAIQALKAALVAATPDWFAVSFNDSANIDGTHIEIHDGYGRTATVYGEPEDAEVVANANLMELSQKHMADLLEAANALNDIREAYMKWSGDNGSTDGELFETLQGILLGNSIPATLERLNAGDKAPEAQNQTPPQKAPALELLDSAQGSLADACEQLEGTYQPGSSDYAETAVHRISAAMTAITKAREHLVVVEVATADSADAKPKLNEIVQVVVFASEGITHSVAVRPLPDGAVPCIVVNYDDRKVSGDQFPEPEDFEREMLGVGREEFDKSATYIW